MKIQFAQSSVEIEKCFSVMVQLRTNLTSKEFVERVEKQQKSGYKLVYLEDKDSVIAAAGFRIIDNLAFGKFLYVDDLITDSKNRSNGYGDKLFDWMIDYAKKKQCQEFHLDSGVQRFDAHRFYFRKRMKIIAHHFSLNLTSEE